MIIIAFIGLTNTPVQAKQLVNHPRLRMVIHGGSELTPNVDSRVHIVPSTNLASGLTPYLYLGAAWKPLQWLDIESDMAWDFHNAEPVLAFRPSVKFGDFWSWSDVEIQIPSMSGYWFLQAQYTLSDFIELGIEGEGWGKIGHADTWSHGVGSNMLLHFNKHVAVDIAFSIRHAAPIENRGWSLDTFVRVHIFL